jgi:predicted nucleic acid-binding protein
MRDHVTRQAQRKGTRKSVGVRELKTHAARILRQVREARASYLLMHRGRAIGVMLPAPDSCFADCGSCSTGGYLAATHRLRGADALYVAVAHRYGTTIVSRDD